MILIDTDIAIHWRDKHPTVSARLSDLASRPCISVITRVELENGVYRDPEVVTQRRTRLDLILSRVMTIDFTNDTAAVFSQIVAHCGYSRPRTNDRMIAATAILADATLVTMNRADFRDIPDLRMEVWDAA